MNKRLKDAARLVTAEGLPPSVKEESYVVYMWGKQIPSNSVVGVKINPYKKYKVTKKRIVEIDVRKDFKDFVQKHPNKSLDVLLQEFVSNYKSNHLSMLERAAKVKQNAESVAASTGSEVGTD